MNCGNAVENPLEVDIDASFPGVGCSLVIRIKGKGHYTCVIKHHINLAEVIHRSAREVMHILTVSDISLDGDRLAAVTGYSIDYTSQRL